MNILFIVFTYNRPKVLQESLISILKDSHKKEIFVLDDFSTEDIRANLAQSIIQYRGDSKINLILNGENKGYGYNFEQGYQILNWKNPDVVAFIESDYVFRNGFLDDVLSVFENNPNTVAIPGTSHPDYYKKENLAENGLFKNVMLENFPKDILGREFYYKPFDSKGITVQGVTNSCGCFFLHWRRFKDFIFNQSNNKSAFEYFAYKSFHKFDLSNRRLYGDGVFTSAITYFWNQWAINNKIDLSTNFPWLDICDYSIGQHLCAGGINGNLPGIQEGETFVGSPVWPLNWKSFQR